MDKLELAVRDEPADRLLLGLVEGVEPALEEDDLGPVEAPRRIARRGRHRRVQDVLDLCG